MKLELPSLGMRGGAQRGPAGPATKVIVLGKVGCLDGMTPGRSLACRLGSRLSGAVRLHSEYCDRTSVDVHEDAVSEGTAQLGHDISYVALHGSESWLPYVVSHWQYHYGPL